MMKVLLSERSLDGHRRTYMQWLSQIKDVECYILAPENVGCVEADHYVEYPPFENLKSIKAYCFWIRQMREMVRKYDIDVVHILDGDSIMRFFGLGFCFLGAKRIIVTYHHFFSGFARKISYRLMCRGDNWACVAHTQSVQDSLKATGIRNVELCQYPAFNFERIAERIPAQCKEKWGLATEIPVIGIVGGMSRYKNIIPFLMTMRNCKSDFRLLICGKEDDVSREEIMTAVEPYAKKVVAEIRHLSDEEYETAIVASDIIFCIYGYEFDGASGPLTDGVCAQKMILACKHGSLGEIVSKSDLGLAVRCDDAEAILQNTERALRMAMVSQYSADALKYRNALQPKQFCDRYQKIYSGA